jgi:hypothetical protein
MKSNIDVGKFLNLKREAEARVGKMIMQTQNDLENNPTRGFLRQRNLIRRAVIQSGGVVDYFSFELARACKSAWPREWNLAIGRFSASESQNETREKIEGKNLGA